MCIRDRANGSQVGAIDNTIAIGSRLNWEQRLGYFRQRSYSYYNQQVTGGDGGNLNYGVGSTVPGGLAPGMPGILMKEFAINNTASTTPSLYVCLLYTSRCV